MSLGRKPKPTQIKVVTGNPGKRPLNHNEPKFKLGIKSMPSWIKGEAKKNWNRLIKILSAANIVTEADRSAFAIYCQLYSEIVELQSDIDKEGFTHYSDKTNRYFANPKVNILNTKQRLFISLSSEFGLTPSSRSRFVIPSNIQDDDFPELM